MSHQKERLPVNGERRLVLFRELEKKVALGDALELTEVVIGLTSGDQIGVLVDRDSLVELSDFINDDTSPSSK